MCGNAGFKVVFAMAICAACMLLGAALVSKPGVPYLRAFQTYLDLNWFYRREAVTVQAVLASINPQVTLLQSPSEVVAVSSAALAVVRATLQQFRAR